MNEIRLSGLLLDRYKTKFFGLVHKFSYPVLGYSLTPCSYHNNLSSHPLRDCSMHSPLRIKIQNAINKALQLEHTDVLFVGGRRRNRKRRKHAKDKKKSKKYEGKETPILKAKTYSGNNGKYIALLGGDDISLSPSMVDDLLDGTSLDATSFNKEDCDNENNDEKRSIYDESDCNEDTKETEYESSEIYNDEITLQDELNNARYPDTTIDRDRHNSCDTGYNSEDEHKTGGTSRSLDDEEIAIEDETDILKHAEMKFSKEKSDNTEENIFFLGKEVVTDNTLEINTDMEAPACNEVIVTETNISMEHELENIKNEKVTDIATNKETDEKIEYQTDVGGLEQDKGVQINNKDDTFPTHAIKEPRITENFDYEEEDEEEIYTKQPKSWFQRKTEKDEELKPLICCADDTGVGFACCTIL